MNKTAANAPGDKIRLGEKLCYMLTNMGNGPIMSLIGTFLMIFYTDVAGIDPAVVATLFLISRLVDGLNDPIVGFIIDHLPRTKMGRFRPYLMIGSVLCALNYLLLWFGPVLFPSAKIVMIYVSYLLIGITFDLMDIPLNSLIPAMTDDIKQRNNLSALKSIANALMGMLLSLTAPLVINANKDNPLRAYALIIGVSTAIVLVFSIAGAAGVRERVVPISDEKYKFKDLFKIITVRPVLISFITMLLVGISSGISGGSNAYFAQYIIKDITILSLSALALIVGGIPGLLLSLPLTNKFGKKFVYCGGAIIAQAFALMRLFNVRSALFILVLTALGAVGAGMIMPLTYGIQADNTDYVEYQTGNRAEGAIASLNSFVVKAGGGIGGAIPGYILSVTGYVANAEQQTAGAETGIIVCAILLPALVTIAGILTFALGYPLNRTKVEEVTQTLRRRREEKSLQA